MQTAKTAQRAAVSLAALTGAALIALTTLPALAQDADATDRIVATANGEPITESEAMETLARMPAQFQQQPVQMVLPMVIQQIAIGRLIQNRAIEEGFADDAEVLKRLAEAERGIIQDVWVERQLDATISEEGIDEQYAAYLEANPPADEVSARHILLETEEEAVAVIEELNGGADFATLAQERSTGPSGPNGGDLGYFAKEQMVPEFAEVAFSLEPGTVTQTPVKTQFGWHVIKVEDARTTEPPTLEDLRPQLENQVRQESLRTLIADVQAEAEIVFMDQDGNPIEMEEEAEGEAEAEDDGEASE